MLASTIMLELLRKKIPLEWPVMLIFDNINIYKGHSRHIRLKKSTVPSMWNFTVRAVLKPNICGMEYLWRDPDTAFKPQGELKKVKSEPIAGAKINIFIYNNNNNARHYMKVNYRH